MDNQKIIEIDGSFGSGGGEILRTACDLSAVTKKPCHIFNIRKNRPKPGLAIQHLLGIQSLAQLYQSRLEGDKLGSNEINFFPTGREQFSPSQPLTIKIETAGSITLVLQTLILPALLSLNPVNPVRDSQISNGVKIIFDGGATDTFFSPTLDYFNFVFLKILEKIGIKVEINILKRGYYPEGGAKVEVTIYPSELTPHHFSDKSGEGVNLTKRGELKKILAISGASEFLKTKKVAERQMAGVREVLGKLNLPIEEKCEYYPTKCPGSQICLITEFENTLLGTDNLGKLGQRAEDVGKEAALDLLKEQKSGACLDKHLADQILPYLALTSGKSQISVSEITEHCQTNIWVIEKFIDGKFEIKEDFIKWIPE